MEIIKLGKLEKEILLYICLNGEKKLDEIKIAMNKKKNSNVTHP